MEQDVVVSSFKVHPLCLPGEDGNWLNGTGSHFRGLHLLNLPRISLLPRNFNVHCRLLWTVQSTAKKGFFKVFSKITLPPTAVFVFPSGVSKHIL